MLGYDQENSWQRWWIHRHLNHNGLFILEPKQIANPIRQTISNNSSSAKYVSKFQRFKQIQERQNLNFAQKNTVHYNQLFTIQKFK